MFSPTDLGENQLDFSSFWSHYKLVKKWLNIEGAAREKILKELADKSSSSDQVKNLKMKIQNYMSSFSTESTKSSPIKCTTIDAQCT
jgi:hypothetical protein